MLGERVVHLTQLEASLDSKSRKLLIAGIEYELPPCNSRIAEKVPLNQTVIRGKDTQ